MVVVVEILLAVLVRLDIKLYSLDKRLIEKKKKKIQRNERCRKEGQRKTKIQK